SRAPLATLPLALFARHDAGLTSVGQLWAKSPVPFRLAVSQSAPAVMANFEHGLRGLGMEWLNRRAVSSFSAALKAVETAGDIAVGVIHPALRELPGIRVLALP